MDRQEFTLDRCTRYVLVAITALLTVIAVELWAPRPSMLPAAIAQIPDSGRQRQDMVGELRKTNGLLGQILNHLRTKPIKVSVDAPDKPGSKRATRGRQ